ncbi:MAG: hypothetical protein JW856_04850 [Dehalococcoidales bacterium]|nr:hypothetical protein [Dehalococcoidales bacterium]
MYSRLQYRDIETTTWAGSVISRNWLESLILSIKRFLSKNVAELNEEPYASNWKNYYEILRVSPDATPRDIIVAYRRLNNSCRDSLSLGYIDEAYQVLMNPARRHTYNQLLTAKQYAVRSDNPFAEEVIQLSGLVDKYVSSRRKPEALRVPRLPPAARQAVLVGITSFLIVMLSGTSFAMAQPSHVMAQPFKGMAITLLEISSGAIELIDEARGTAAEYEHSIVQTAVQSMRIVESVAEVPVVTTPTNDMSIFPSPEHPLFPAYLDKQYSQFGYTTDDCGNAIVDPTTATTDGFLGKIKELIGQLESE